MTSSRIGAVLLAASLAGPAAHAAEHTAYEYLAALPGALQPCRAGMAVSKPASWRPGDGVAVVMTMRSPQDAWPEALVAALLSQHAAVVDLVPLRCDGTPARAEDVVAGARDALEVASRTLGAGLMVAIAHGPGARAMLDIAQRPAAPGPGQPRYAAAVALGDGAPAFVPGAAPSAHEDATPRLFALCEALAEVVGGMGASAERAAPAAASKACFAAMAAGEARGATVVPAVLRR